MTDKKPSDKEIIKALECISGKANDWDCDKCSFDSAICTSFVAESSLALINRQKAEIEELKKEVAKDFTCFVGDPHKVEHCPYLEELETAKAEAIKEFAAELKENGYHNSEGEIIVFEEDIDNLLKEKVGDNHV